MRTLMTLVLALVATAGHAQILGVLVKSESTTSVTGRLIWRCTYNVGGSYQTVLLENICPPSMQFR